MRIGSQSGTAWGDPDLQGIWNGKTRTPLERPDEFADREFLTDEEVLALEAKASAEPGRDARATRGSHEDVEGAYNDVFTERVSSVVRTKRTSLNRGFAGREVTRIDRGRTETAEPPGTRR